jgi:hypothetical protein
VGYVIYKKTGTKKSPGEKRKSGGKSEEEMSGQAATE